MTDIFIKLLNMSLTAGWLILAVVLFRLLFAKAPKALRVLLWGLVALRLLVPFSFESELSLVPNAKPIPEQMHTGVTEFNDYFNPIVGEQLPPIGPSGQLAASPEQNALAVVIEYAAVLWLVGMAVVLLYACISYLRLRFRLREAVLYRKNVWLCDRIDTPFLLGIFRVRIILPSFLDESEYAPVLAHENAHLRRFDHIWKPLGFALLTVYWFHPLIWLAYILLCRDIELACDEKVIKTMDTEQTKAYTKTLLRCSAPHKLLSACPLAFGEIGVSARVKNALHYKKPAFWLILLAIIACTVTAVCFLTDPPAENEPSSPPAESSSPDSSTDAEASMSEEPTYEITAQTYVNGLVVFAAEPTVGFQTDNLSYVVLTEEEQAKLYSGDNRYFYYDDLAGWGNPYMNECKIDCALYFGGEWCHLSKETKTLYHGIEMRGVTDAYLQMFDDLQKRAVPLTDDSPIYSDTISYRLETSYVDADGRTWYWQYILQLQKSNKLFHLYNSDEQTVLSGTYKLTEKELFLYGQPDLLAANDPQICVLSRVGDGFAYDGDKSETALHHVSDGQVFMPLDIFYDFDEDGVPETVDFCIGPTSGISSFCVFLCERGIPSYDMVVSTWSLYMDEYGYLVSRYGEQRGELKIIDGKLKLFVDGKESKSLR